MTNSGQILLTQVKIDFLKAQLVPAGGSNRLLITTHDGLSTRLDALL